MTRQDTIDRQLSDIKFEIKDLRKTREKIENLLLSKTANNLKIGETEEDLFQNLPVSSVEELENFNIKLEDKQVLNRLVAFLYVLGREDAHKTIYVMLKKVMTNEVAQLFSTQGRKQKRAFLELKNLYGAITMFIAKTNSHSQEERIDKKIENKYKMLEEEQSLLNGPENNEENSQELNENKEMAKADKEQETVRRRNEDQDLNGEQSQISDEEYRKNANEDEGKVRKSCREIKKPKWLVDYETSLVAILS
ncbi:hypothetical protein RN001_008742 [Aquatica leii]|uniref:DUF4806 domain-containing protein n=1 Tax=Aquatica leii TaxID=1421715 RepID=A0AAN7PHM2_9COLE|nr:hypothetical protein RN001_008742 [Aquatica leii]